ncbi:hypothetical protein [Chryseobacterium sp.]|uniref:hypothetical protein n=1 Tax=Chryseobacterium sp. TaxID=1871047 RepID=UPI00262C6FD8|nr:hypothetical protein [Chryseobacterium sp.]
MKSKKTLLLFFSLLVALFMVNRLNTNDYFQSNYKDLTPEQESIFKWKNGDDENSLQKRYKKYLSDKSYAFPRQNVSKVKLFENIPLAGPLMGKTLKPFQINRFINFCNDPENFDWKETTWQVNDSEYYFKLYNDDNEVVGKIYFCLEKCGMTSSKPFCPAMKFGGLSEKGKNQIEKLINDKANWD